MGVRNKRTNCDTQLLMAGFLNRYLELSQHYFDIIPKLFSRSEVMLHTNGYKLKEVDSQAGSHSQNQIMRCLIPASPKRGRYGFLPIYNSNLMDNKNQLNLKGQQYRQMIDKFKQREEQTSLQEALVYLKLREFECDNSKALIFAKKKEKCIDGTINKDGPPGFRKLEVLKPESKLVNGWLRGEKLRYSGTTGYSDSLHKNQSAEKREITKYNQKSRQIQEEMRKARSKSLVTIDVMKPRESLQKIGAIKEDASKERQNRNMYVEFNGVRLDQTTKNFFKDAENLNDEGLIVRLGAFDNIIADKDLTLKVDQQNMKGKTLTHYEVTGNKKRQTILTYQDKIREFTQGHTISEPKDHRWKGLIHRKANDEKQLFFTKGNVEAASNALILMNSKQLKRDLSDNEGRCGENLTKYSSFYNSLEKAVTLEFLNKRKFSSSEIGFKKRRSLQIDREQ